MAQTIGSAVTPAAPADAAPPPPPAVEVEVRQVPVDAAADGPFGVPLFIDPGASPGTPGNGEPVPIDAPAAP